MRNITITLIFISFLVGAGMLSLKGEVQVLEKNISNVNKKVLEEQKMMRALKAEWSHLNRPERLARLNKKHLNLIQISPESIYIKKDFALTDGFKEKKFAQK